jgi:hypothetical protein
LVFGWRWGYRKREAQAVARAGSYVAAGDFRSAQLTLEQAVQMNPRNVEARRALAEFYSRLNLPRGLALWQELGAEDPSSDVYALGEAGAALRLKKYDVADQALARVSEEGRANASYKRHRAAVALAKGDRRELSRQLAELAVLEPDNLRMRYNAAAAAANSADPAEAAEARARRVEIARGDALRIRATLQLIQLASMHPDATAETGRVASAVLNLRGGRRAGLFELAEHMRAEPSPSPEDAAALIEWMGTQDRAREAVLWADDLPPAAQRTLPVRRAVAGCAVRMRDWVRLQEQLHAGAWGTLPSGLLELAFAARVQRENANRARALETWAEALALAAKERKRPAFDALAKLAALWDWAEADEKTLWRAHEILPGELSYLRRLAALAEAGGDSGRLDQIYRAWTAVAPADRYALASQLYLAVLRDNLDAGLRAKAAVLIAREDILPEEAMVWAWAEAGKGPTAANAALDRVARLVPQIRERPRAALLHAALLAQAGRLDEARESWRAAASLTAKLPEERALFIKTRARLESGR